MARRNHDHPLSRWWDLSPFNQWEFPFLEKRKIPKMSTVPIFFSLSTPSHVKSPVLRWPPVLSRFYLCVQRSSNNTRKQSAVNSLREIVLSYRYNTWWVHCFNLPGKTTDVNAVHGKVRRIFLYSIWIQRILKNSLRECFQILQFWFREILGRLSR